MSKIQSAIYEFDECQYTNVRGQPGTLPAGIYPVAELDVVSIAVGTAVIEMSGSAFNLLKVEGKARKIR